MVSETGEKSRDQQMEDAARLFGESQVALRDLYASTKRDDRGPDFWPAVQVISENRKLAYYELMVDEQIFEAMASGGMLNLGDFTLTGILIQPGKATDNEKGWLKITRTGHFIKLKVGGIRT